LIVKIKYLGHSAFVITSEEGLRIVTDPYTRGPSLTYGEITESADIVTVSHEHLDHSNTAAVGGNPQVVKGAGRVVVKGIEFNGIASYHDEARGRMRGNNTIFCFDVDGMRVCHLGDLGHLLDDRQILEMGNVDILFIPVGGNFTIDARAANQVCNQLKPAVIIPMHYKTEKGIPGVSGVDAFIKNKDNVTQLDSSEAEFKREELPPPSQIMVFRPAL
jgi:L-ascorbate metabolism protein UlaG (beta-lactamase superfamily)